jgi:mono/diheme cytochrome c family protein
MRLILASAGALALALIAAAAGAQQGNGAAIEDAFRGAIQDRSHQGEAEALFVQKCGMCHRQMGMGTVILARRMSPDVARLERRDDLTPDFVVAAARNGIGNMPRIQRGEVSDAQLASIARYLAKGKE